MDGDPKPFSLRTVLACLWRRGHRAFADSRITPLIVLLLILGLLLPMVATGYFIFRSELRALHEQFDEELHRTGQVLARSSSSLLWNLQRDIAEAMLQSHLSDERICEIRIQDKLSGRVFVELHNAHCEGARHEVLTPIFNGSTEIGTVRLLMGDGWLQTQIAGRVRELALLFGLLMLVLLSIVVPALVFKVIQPLRRLKQQTGKLSGGNLALAFEWRQGDEIGQVGRAMDEARRKLKELLEEQTRQAARQAIIDQQREENLRLSAAVEQQTRSLREAIARAEASSQAKSTFLSTVSHELRAPLHDILGYAELLNRKASPEARDQLAVIQQSGQQLLRLINDILDFSRGEAKPIVLEPVPLSLSRLADHLAKVYRARAAQGNNRLITRIDTGALDWVLADERRLMQILRNLLENACKFTQNGRIELHVQALPRRPAEDPALCRVRLCVTDTGIGIPRAQRRIIFEPFNRLDRHTRIGGLGLGLAIAQQLARAMGGRITLLSAQGADSGSRFSLTLRLPISVADNAQVDAPRPILGYRGRRRTLLIADDFPTSRGYLADCCRAWGFTVLLAEDGAEALEQLRAAEPPVDAALVDQYMPRLDAWGFLRGVRASAATARLPVVLISAAQMQRPEALPEAMAFDAYAMKPLSEARLAQLLQATLGLEWDYAQPPPSDKGPRAHSAKAPVPRPAAVSDAQVKAFQRMLALGQLSAIQQWARGMAEQSPEQAPLWQDIAQRCSSVDVPGLQRLAKAWQET
ncbi:ATP-binding response regulator [Thiohalocapsa marina]|uniref:ATP-binding response regulator n=1 Tax=Thiohalocapsa marina TaxID=424902 RepID=UPI0036D9258E